jgi:hypothetical protein
MIKKNEVVMSINVSCYKWLKCFRIYIRFLDGKFRPVSRSDQRNSQSIGWGIRRESNMEINSSDAWSDRHSHGLISTIYHWPGELGLSTIFHFLSKKSIRLHRDLPYGLTPCVERSVVVRVMHVKVINKSLGIKLKISVQSCWTT